MQKIINGKPPLVSVLMPAYNCEQYIAEAIESIIQQTYTNWELIIVDDGSTDSTAQIIKSYQTKDERIILYQFSENKGIPFARNKCLELAKGEYLGNLDSDDIALPQRLEKQIQFMEQNLEIGICGTWAKAINDNNQEIGIYRPPQDNQNIIFNLLFATHFMVNTSMMIRKKTILIYQKKYEVTEDYKFLMDSIKNGVVLSNYADILITFRRLETGVSLSKASIQQNQVINISWEFLTNHFGSLDSRFEKYHRESLLNTLPSTLKEFKVRVEWFETLFLLNQEKPFMNSKVLEYRLGERLFKELCTLAPKGLSTLLFYHIRLRYTIKKFKIGFRNYLSFLTDCLLKRRSKYIS